MSHARDWHLRLCEVERAWALLGGRERLDWGGLRVGQLDTGYTQHPVFGFPHAPWVSTADARSFLLDAPPGAGIDPVRAIVGSHGTTSGSVINGDDAAAAYLGVAPRVPLVPARTSDCIIMDWRVHEFEAGLRYLVDEARVEVINVSLGTFLKFSPPEAVRVALDHCYERGVILIAAAGNMPVFDWPAFPGALPRAIAVAGVSAGGRPWWMSSRGPWVDFSAPARGLRRACTSREGRYGYTTKWGGTSFAAAMTSGAAALWLLAHRQAIAARYLQAWQRVEAFRWMARRSATVPPGWAAERGFGAGILNVAALMDPALLPDAAALVRR
jgi:hypothetical protein